MSTDKCDLDVYKNGKGLGFFDMTKQEAEDFCKKQTEETGMKHDWHYFAGRVHIMYLEESKNGTTD